MGRVAAIDFGLKRIGLAVSDEKRKIAFPLKTVEGGRKRIQNIKEALGSKLAEIDTFLIGLPLLLNGKEGEMAALVKEFAKELEASFGIRVEFIDERLSSKQAEQSLRAMDLNRKERGEMIDSATACMLLQAYLERK